MYGFSKAIVLDLFLPCYKFSNYQWTVLILLILQIRDNSTILIYIYVTSQFTSCGHFSQLPDGTGLPWGCQSLDTLFSPANKAFNL